MNVRRVSHNRLLVTVLFALCCLAQAFPALACFEGWGGQQSPSDPPVCVHQCNTANGWSNQEYDVYCTAMTDPVRGLSAAPFLPSQGYYHGTYSYHACVPIMPSGGDAVHNPDGTFSVPTGPSGGGWPKWNGVNPPTPPSDGYYQFKAVYPDQAVFYFYAWRIGGGWTTKAPDPPKDPAPPPIDSSGNTTNAYATLIVNVQNASATPVPASYLFVYLYGKTLAASTADINGSVTFQNIFPGSYQLHLRGSMTNSAGNNISVDAKATVTISQNETQTVNMTIDDKGNIKQVTLGSSTTQDPNAAPSWLQSTVQSLFVPDQQHIDEVKGSLSGIYTWGPFALVADLVGLTNQTATPMSPIGLPVPQLDACGCRWQPTTTVTKPIDFTPITSLSGFATLRSLMGGSVWLTFVIGLGWKLIPRQQV